MIFTIQSVSTIYSLNMGGANPPPPTCTTPFYYADFQKHNVKDTGSRRVLWSYYAEDLSFCNKFEAGAAVRMFFLCSITWNWSFPF